jgi:hypothetical protein
MMSAVSACIAFSKLGGACFAVFQRARKRLVSSIYFLGSMPANGIFALPRAGRDSEKVIR